MPRKKKDIKSKRILRQAESRRERLSKQAQGPAAARLSEGAEGLYKLKQKTKAPSQLSRRKVSRDKTKEFRIPESPYTPPIKSEAEGETETEFGVSNAPGSRDPKTDIKFAGASEDFDRKMDPDPSRRLRGKQLATTSTAKRKSTLTPEQIATKIGYAKPDIMVKRKHKVKAGDHGGPAKSKTTVKTKRFTAEKPTRQERKEGKQAKFTYTEKDINPRTGKPSKYYTEVTEKQKQRGRTTVSKTKTKRKRNPKYGS